MENKVLVYLGKSHFPLIVNESIRMTPQIWRHYSQVKKENEELWLQIKDLTIMLETLLDERK